MASRFYLVCWISGLIVGTMSASITFDVPVPGCPRDWTRLGSRCFIFRNTAKAFGDAESTCISLGGNLASIHSAKEQDFVRELINTEPGSHSVTWIGGHDGVKEGMWMWTDGSKFDYQHWHSGEPNNHGGEKCAELNPRGGKWNDNKCECNRPFVCAKDL